jgi:glycosyltransferase involved in cell wall biosynthesis
MRIGIDIRYLSHGLLGGVHTYVRDLVPALLDAASADEFILYFDQKSPLEIVPSSRAVLRQLPWRNALSSVYNDFAMARWMAADRLDVVHFPANYGFAPRNVCTVISLHDALNLLPITTGLKGLGNTKGARTAAMVCYLHAVTRAALRRATLLVTVSEHAKREIAAAGNWPLDRLAVVPLGAPLAEALPDAVRMDKVLETFELRPGFVLADALKNPGVLVAAWRMLRPEIRQNHMLVFFSRRPQALPIVAEAVARGEARFLLRPSDDELKVLYRMAAVFVFPSWIEGFGLPLLEAMTCGAAIVASDRGSIPEVVGDAAMLVDAEDSASLAISLERVLTSHDEREMLRTRGLRRVAEFTWRRTADQTLAAYREAAAIHKLRGGRK